MHSTYSSPREGRSAQAQVRAQAYDLRPIRHGGRSAGDYPMRAAIYARVSTFDQEPENQLQELRRYVGARGWTGQEYVDRGVSGAKDRRPALDQMVADDPNGSRRHGRTQAIRS
jgi:hypothetical protein